MLLNNYFPCVFWTQQGSHSLSSECKFATSKKRSWLQRSSSWLTIKCQTIAERTFLSHGLQHSVRGDKLSWAESSWVELSQTESSWVELSWAQLIDYWHFNLRLFKSISLFKSLRGVLTQELHIYMLEQPKAGLISWFYQQGQKSAY